MKGPLSFLIAACAAAGVAYAGIAPSSPPSAGSPSAPAGLSLNADCASSKLTVTIDVTPHGGNVINAGQYFLDFNPTILDFQTATAGEAPFEFIIMPPDVDQGAGTIEGFATGSLVGPGSNQPKTMAVLIFDVDPNEVNECDVLENLVTWQDPPPGEPRTKLTLDGGQLFDPEPLEHLGPVTYDSLAPQVGPVTITPGDPCELVVNFEADVLEECCLGPVKVEVTFPDNPDDPCATVLNVSVSQVPIAGGVKVFGFALFSNLTSCPCNIEIEIIATDCCGQFGANSNTYAVEDMTPPEVTVTSPTLDDWDDFETPADAGYCTAMVEMSATATDNCDGPIDAADIDFIIDTDHNGIDPGDPICSGGGSPCTYTFQVGETLVRAQAKDNCDNEGYYDFTVTVLPYNEMVLDISLQNVDILTCERCIHFEFFNCGGGAAGGDYANLNLLFDEANSGDAKFSGTVLIPCGLWNCITAEDKLHTLRRQLNTQDHPLYFKIENNQYVADFVGAGKPLEGGNYDEFLNATNPFIDVGDFSVWQAEFDQTPPVCYDSEPNGVDDGNTSCPPDFPPSFPNPGAPHADGNCDGCAAKDGALFADFTYIQINWLHRHEECCSNGAPLAGAATPGWGTHKSSATSRELPILQLNVATLTAQGHGELASADLNEDGWIDVVDVLIVMLDQMAGTGLP